MRLTFAISHEIHDNPPSSCRIAAMKFVITLERDEDGIRIAECPSIPGCISQGQPSQSQVSPALQDNPSRL